MKSRSYQKNTRRTLNKLRMKTLATLNKVWLIYRILTREKDARLPKISERA